MLRKVNTEKYISFENIDFIDKNETGKRYHFCISNSNFYLQQYLIHLTHTIVESKLLGILQFGRSFSISHGFNKDSVSESLYSRIVFNRGKFELISTVNERE